MNFALELIEELNLKLTWNVTFIPAELTAIANALGQNTQTITISGLKKDGSDATNELSYLFLEAYRDLKVFTTDLSVCIHSKTPEAFFKAAVSVFRSTSGIAFYNDEVIVPALEKAGYTRKDAWDYVIIGCVEPTGQGNSFAATGRMFMNLPGGAGTGVKQRRQRHVWTCRRPRNRRPCQFCRVRGFLPGLCPTAGLQWGTLCTNCRGGG